MLELWGRHHDPCSAFGLTVLRQDNFTQQKHEASSIQETLTAGIRKRTISHSTECGKNAVWPLVFIYGGLHPAREAEGRWEKRSKSAAQLKYRQRGRERERRLQTCWDIVTHKWHEIRRWYASRLSVERRRILVTVTCLVRRPPMGKLMSTWVFVFQASVALRR
jgi:hypothetical protein